MEWTSFIPAAANLVGGLLGNDSAEDINAANIQNQNNINSTNIALQREFAQNGIRWKVEDAKAAGLHPLAALGAQTLSFSPISVGAQYQADNSMGQAFSNIGQDISRAIHATRTAEERNAELEAAKARQAQLDAINVERHQADLAHMELQNALLYSQIRRLNQEQPPSMPSSVGSVGGVTNPKKRYGSVTFQDSKITSANPFNQSLEAGPQSPAMKKYRLGGPESGFTVDVPGQQFAESLEPLGPLGFMYLMGHNFSQWWDAGAGRAVKQLLTPELYQLYKGTGSYQRR